MVRGDEIGQMGVMVVALILGSTGGGKCGIIVQRENKEKVITCNLVIGSSKATYRRV